MYNAGTWVVVLGILMIVLLAFSRYIAVRERYGINPRSFDPVTGLCLLSTGERFVARMLSRLTHGQVALGLIKVNNMGQLREQCGSDVCDAVLRDVAGQLSSDVGMDGHVYRAKDDEFLVALPFEGDDDEAKARVDALRALFDGTLLDLSRRLIDRRASAGIAICPTNGNQYAELYDKAEQALFWSIRMGKADTLLYQELDGMDSAAG